MLDPLFVSAAPSSKITRAARFWITTAATSSSSLPKQHPLSPSSKTLINAIKSLHHPQTAPHPGHSGPLPQHPHPHTSAPPPTSTLYSRIPLQSKLRTAGVRTATACPTAEQQAQPRCPLPPCAWLRAKASAPLLPHDRPHPTLPEDCQQPPSLLTNPSRLPFRSQHSPLLGLAECLSPCCNHQRPHSHLLMLANSNACWSPSSSTTSRQPQALLLAA